MTPPDAVSAGLNALRGSKAGQAGGWAWDDANARELVEYTRKNNYPVVGWELGCAHCHGHCQRRILETCSF